MRLVFLSDTHNHHRRIRVPEGDVLIHAGDATGSGEFREIASFLAWLDALPHPHKILVAGNHDFCFEPDHEKDARYLLDQYPGIIYLQDSGVEIGGFRFWGSPWQPAFMNWAFNLPRKSLKLREKWNQIPMDTDVLVTHGPPHCILDKVRQVIHLSMGPAESESEPLGCEELRIRALTVQPLVHVFGHIHDAYGMYQGKRTTWVNASNCNEAYQPVNPPIIHKLRRRKA